MISKLVACSLQLVGKSSPKRSQLPATSYQLHAKKGFTLIELLVVVAIIVMVSAAIFANTNKFGGQTLLQNLAYDIALSVREAQVYGISVQGSTGNFNTGYGMHFDTTHTTTYHLFDDIQVNGVYDATPVSEDVKPSPYTIGQGFYISGLCAPAIPCTPVTSLDVIFIRPEPDAWINATCSVINGVESCSNGTASASITVTSPRGGTMRVIIYANGQISVLNP